MMQDTMPPPASLARLQAMTTAGYTYYRDVPRQRADDLLVRNRAADLICQEISRVAEAVQAARRAMPPPTREHPYANPALMAEVTRLRGVQDRLASLETRLRGPAALPDRDFSAWLATPDHSDRLVQLDAALLDATEAPNLAQRLDEVQALVEARTELAMGLRRV